MTRQPYGPSFWWTYLANISLMVAVSLLFRYADFVSFLGGSERELGLITGLGMVGAIAARCFQGVAIDRYGPVRVWTFSLCLLASCLLAHLRVSTLQPPAVHLLRICYTVSLAGAFGASITFVSLQAPARRLGEMIGMLGSSGFVGMAIGPVVGDWLFSASEDLQQTVANMFVWAVAAAATSLICAVLAGWTGGLRGGQVESNTESTTHDPTQSSFRQLWANVSRYHPGWTLLVGAAMGVGIGMPGVFVRTFAAEKGFAGVRFYFLTYAIAAFVVRICTRTLSDRWGTRPTILSGLICLAASMFAYLCVTTEASLMIPAIIAGCGHAFLFPATVAESNQAFPIEHRGLATTLILMMFDIGLLVGQPAIGLTIDSARTRGLDGYAVMFCGLAMMLLGVAAIYSLRKPIVASATPVVDPYLATKSDL